MKTNQALAQYLAYLKEIGKSEKTLYTYGKDAEQITAFFKDKELIELNKLVLGKFLNSAELNQQGNGKSRAQATINKTIGFLRRFIEWCLAEGLLNESPLPKTMVKTQ